MKIIGICLIVLTTSGIGFFLSNKSRKRILELEAIIIMLEKIKSYISFQKIKTKNIFIDLANSDQLKSLLFIEEFKRNVDDSSDFKTIWNYSVNNSAPNMNLSKKEIQLVCSISDLIGCTNNEGQLGGIDLMKNMIDECLNEARSNYLRKGKPQLSLWILSGIVLAIMLI
jgi:stage III sporulation protein AB